MRLHNTVALAAVCAVLASSCRRADERVNVPLANTDSGDVFVFQGPPISSTADVVVVASHLLKERGVDWGEPVEILWQEELTRYLVLYATPEREILEVGERGVFVMTNGNAIVMPQM